MNYRDLAFELLIGAFISTVMVVLRYGGGWEKVNPGFLDCLGVIAACHPGMSGGCLSVVVWLLRAGASWIIAGLIFWKGGNQRRVSYAMVVAATICINLLMGLGEVNFGGD